MADIVQNNILIEVITKTIEQKFESGTALTGVIPTLSSEPADEQDFVPFVSEDDGIVRMKNPGPTTPAGTLDEADAGGLFVLQHDQPGILEQVIADLSSVVVWSVALVTTAGEYALGSGTSDTINITPRAFLMPGEKVKVVAATPTGKPWVRIYVRSDQARH